MTAWATTLGTTLSVALLAGFPIAFAVVPDAPDLRVEVDSPHAFVVRADSRDETPSVVIEPIPVPDGLEVRDSMTGPGLDLRTWSVTYSHRWEREVTLPILTGPFVKEGDEVCGLGVAIGAGLFDTSGAGAGLQAMLERKISESLPYTYRHPKYGQVSVTFPKPRSLTLRIGLLPGRLAFLVNLVLLDGTELDAFFAAQFIDAGGTPALVRLGPVISDWRGPTHDDLLLQAAAVGADAAEEEHPIVALFFEGYVRAEGAREGLETAQRDGPVEANRKLTELVDSALKAMSLGLERLTGPHYPIANNKEAGVRLRLLDPPAISPKGIALRLCASTEVGSKIDASIPGSVRAPATSPATPTPKGDASIELTADGDALNHLLYFMWQSGALRAIGTDKGLVQAALERTRDPDGGESGLQKLAFEFNGFDPGLPPTILPASNSASGWSIALGDVKIGAWNGLRVAVHALGTLAIKTVGRDLELEAAVSRIDANCTGPGTRGVSLGAADRAADPTGPMADPDVMPHVDWWPDADPLTVPPRARPKGRMALTPCVSDLMPAIREGARRDRADALVNRPLATHINGADLLAKLPTMAFAGGQLELANLNVTTAVDPQHVSLRVQARVTEGEP